MDTKIKPLPLFYLLFGVVCGFLLGTSLNEEISSLLTKLITALSLIVLLLFGKKIELAFHTEDIRNWPELQAKGKWYFVITRYVLFRGIILFTLFILPAFSSVTVSMVILAASVAGFLFLAGLLTYFGLGEWENSEQEYTIYLLKNAGEQTRIAQN